MPEINIPNPFMGRTLNPREFPQPAQNFLAYPENWIREPGRVRSIWARGEILTCQWPAVAISKTFREYHGSWLVEVCLIDKSEQPYDICGLMPDANTGWGMGICCGKAETPPAPNTQDAFWLTEFNNLSYLRIEKSKETKKLWLPISAHFFMLPGGGGPKTLKEALAAPFLEF